MCPAMLVRYIAVTSPQLCRLCRPLYQAASLLQRPLYYGKRCVSHSACGNSALSERSRPADVGEARPPTFKEKVRENTRTAWYGLVVVCGVGVTGALLFAIGRELLSGDSASGVYSAALQRCLQDPRVLDSLGAPVQARGEQGSRGRRRHVSHVKYTDAQGADHMRLQFYLKGARNTATVFVDLCQSGEGGSDEYRYLFVEVDDASRRVIVLEDNRLAQSSSLPPLPPL